MSGLDGVIQATLQNAQALNEIANNLPDSLPTIFLDSITVFQTTTIGLDANSVTVAGNVFAGDGGGGLYIRSPTPGPGTGLVKSADGQWWVLVTNSLSLPNLFLDSAVSLAGTIVPTYVTNVTVAGTNTPADGGELLFVHSFIPGPGDGKVQSADGQWWRPATGPLSFLDTQAVLHTTNQAVLATSVLVAGTTAVDDGGTGLYVRWSGAAGPDTVFSGNFQLYKLMRQSLIQGTATLNTGSATSTNVSNTRCTSGSRIFLQATSSAASGIHPFISSVGSGSFTITHDANTLSSTFFYHLA